MQTYGKLFKKARSTPIKQYLYKKNTGMKKILCSWILSLFIAQLMLAQGFFPENGPLYIDTVVPRIDITVDPDTLTWIYENPESETEFHAMFVFNNGTVLDTINPVGFRLRGNTSRYSAKKSFKVSLNTFLKGEKYYGVEKINLNGEHNDPTIMRSKVMWDILRKFNIPAPRANHVRLYINGNYHGLYINVEHVDEEFVLTRFGNNDGNLFKCLYPADLDYISSNPNDYKLEAGDRRVYELKTNEEADDYTDLYNLINIVNNADENHLICQLDEVFNTYDYLKVMAADLYCGDWDGYIYNKNNYYIYHNTTTGKMEFIPYDVDNTFGIDWFNIDWTTRDIYNWQPEGEPRPLYTRLVDNPELRKQFTFYADELINRAVNIDSLIQSIEIRKNMIAPYVANDPFYPLDYGYSYDDFLRSYNESTGAHVKKGLYPYLNERATSMNVQLESTSMAPVIKYIRHKREAGQQIRITAFVDVQTVAEMVAVLYSLNDGEIQQAEMVNEENGNYAVTLTDISEETKVSYQVSVTDGLEQEQILPCEARIINPATGDTPLLFINELMADNAHVIADEYGVFSDWLEVYNGDSEPVFLGDYFLTDNLDSPNKWQMPDISIPVGGFELFWADGDPTLGSHHTNFKLSKDGEEVGIFSLQLIAVDEIVFGVQLEDISYGRVTDGNTSLVFFTTSTPGSTNNPSSIDETDDLPQLIAYPNPATGEVVNLNRKINARVFNSSGKMMFSGSQISSIDIGKFAPGLYVVVSEDGARVKFMIY